MEYKQRTFLSFIPSFLSFCPVGSFWVGKGRALSWLKTVLTGPGVLFVFGSSLGVQTHGPRGVAMDHSPPAFLEEFRSPLFSMFLLSAVCSKPSFSLGVSRGLFQKPPATMTLTQPFLRGTPPPLRVPVNFCDPPNVSNTPGGFFIWYLFRCFPPAVFFLPWVQPFLAVDASDFAGGSKHFVIWSWTFLPAFDFSDPTPDQRGLPPRNFFFPNQLPPFSPM